jgi:8-oxo-dGTP pyrophosphatase MutT (NUDIX family)
VALKLWRLRSRPRPDETGSVVRAAGGVVRRRAKSGRADYALVHRPRYDDWSLPKGKLDPGETDEEAAQREVEEETGVRAELLAELSPTRYPDRKGRLKQVRYWLMEPVDGKTPKFRPNNEIDEVRWCAADDAGKLLDHEHDRKLIAEAEALP